MSLILFFGLAIGIFILGLIYVALVVHHHWIKPRRRPTSDASAGTQQKSVNQ